MFIADGVEYEFHHLGIPTQRELEHPRFSERLGMYTSDSECRLARVQWHRFTDESEIDPQIRTLPHLAFKVSDLDRAVAGRRLLFGPYEPIAGFRVAMNEDGGMPVELIQTTLSDDQMWHRAREGTGTLIY
jgi:hypothetical protein